MSSRLVAAIMSIAIAWSAWSCGRSDSEHAATSARPRASRESTVGIPARIDELVLPGPEIAVAAPDARSPIVLRILRTSPHGTDFRYDIEYSGLDPGEYDLRRYLRRKDGSSVDGEGSEVPPIPVTIRTELAAGQLKPHAPGEGALPRFGGYRALLIAGAVVWTLGLAAILFARRRRQLAIAMQARPRTLAERLRPLVERAQAGSLSRSERAALELSLVAYWRRKLGLEELRPAEALERLRAHAEAGPLLLGLEQWLHRPGPHTDVDVAALLAPYRDLPADALDAELDGQRDASSGGELGGTAAARHTHKPGGKLAGAATRPSDTGHRR